MSADLDYKNVDIWEEAIKVPREVYKKEREIHTWHHERMKKHLRSPYGVASAFEAWEGQPIRFFMFRVGNQIYCGRKILSPIVTVHKSPGFFCSLIKPEMILGEFLEPQISQQGVEIFYREIDLDERLRIFGILKNDRLIDIVYPFVHHL